MWEIPLALFKLHEFMIIYGVILIADLRMPWGKLNFCNASINITKFSTTA